MDNRPTKLIMVLSAVLLAVLAVSGVVLWLLPFGGSDTGTNTTDTSAVVPGGSATGFNLRVLQTSSYLSLDQKPVSEGALPVQPPAATGKANPFL